MNTRFVCQFAIGENGLARSGVWRVWTAKNQPDLYIAAKAISGEIKATVHAPRPPTMPGWKRHYGFDRNAVGAVAKQAMAIGSRHKTSWNGCPLGGECTLEYRIIVRGTSLDDGITVSNDVTLLPIRKRTNTLRS